MNRGSVGDGLGRLSKVFASMRPRFMNRGSDTARGAVPEAMSGFNEAPIHESGKSPAAASRRRAGCCFNEAPIHESGKSS